MNLFIDDERTPEKNPDYLKSLGFGELYFTEEWIVLTSYWEFKDWIEANGLPTRISFDHDLGNEGETILPTGNDCVLFLVEYCLDNNLELTTDCEFHTANPVGKENMLSRIHNYKKFYNSQS